MEYITNPVVRSFFRSLKSLWLESLSSRVEYLSLKAPIVSITFDDVPYSTFVNGVPILNKYGIKTTFYCCLGVIEEFGLLNTDNIMFLKSEGHEIACHTATHYSLSSGCVSGLVEDAKRNRDLYCEFMNGYLPKNFSFPFGQLTHRAKHALQPYYQTLRSTRMGVNSGRCDFNCLRAVSLEYKHFTDKLINSWLDYLERKNGWLIFYTHGITDKPTYYDITPHMLEFLIQSILKRNFLVMPVSNVVSIISKNSSIK